MDKADDMRIGGQNRRPYQASNVRRDGWTKRCRQTFVDVLAETCNVRAAARTAGLSPSSAYRLRRSDPVFAGLWQEAMALGYERLEIALLHHALVGVNALEIGGEAGWTATPDPEQGAQTPPPGLIYGPGIAGDTMTPVQVQVALAVLNRRDAADRRGAAPRGLRQATLAEAESALTRGLDALARKLRATTPGGGTPA